MLGTIVNTGSIIVGSIVGSLLKKGLGEKYQNVLFNAMGLASLALGANTFVQNMPKSEFPVLFIIAIALGGILGTALDLDGRTKRLIAKRGGEGLANGLISACLLSFRHIIHIIFFIDSICSVFSLLLRFFRYNIQRCRIKRSRCRIQR